MQCFEPSSLEENKLFDEKDNTDDANIVCAISAFAFQMETPDPAALQKETAWGIVISQVIFFTREGLPQKNNNVDAQKY